jgi:hypothetical protein
MRAIDQWRLIEESLDPDWDEARLSFTVEDLGSVDAGAAVLAPLGPGRAGNKLFLHVRSGGGGREKLQNLLGRLDRKRVWGTLALVDAQVAPRAEPAAAAEPASSLGLAESWDSALRTLPADWSDLLCELELDSTDYLPRAALLGAPLNPTRNPEAIALRFRVGKKGYGASPGMVRRCLERMDAEGITGRVRVLRALSETENVATQGTVWRVAGRSV